MTMRRRLLLGALGCALLGSAPAQAAACCLSSSAFGIGRLALWEQFAVIAGTSASPVAGQWDTKAAWTPNPDGYSENEWRAQLSALVTVHQRLQVSARAPFVLTQKTLDTQAESNGGLGDSLVALRLEPVYAGEYDFLPEVAIHLGAILPLGRTYADSLQRGVAVMGSDVTGRGAWVLSASATFEVARAKWFAQAGGGVTYSLPMAGFEPGHTQQFGMGWQATVAGGAEVYKDLVASLVARYAYEGPIRYDGVESPHSEGYDLGGGPNLAYRLNSHWTLQGGVDLGVYLTGLGHNRPGRTTGSLSVRYAYF